MLKLFKNFTKKEIIFAIVCILLVAVHVWLELKVPDYMSGITKLVQTDGSKMGDILQQGFYMLLVFQQHYVKKYLKKWEVWELLKLKSFQLVV